MQRCCQAAVGLCAVCQLVCAVCVWHSLPAAAYLSTDWPHVAAPLTGLQRRSPIYVMDPTLGILVRVHRCCYVWLQFCYFVWLLYM